MTRHHLAVTRQLLQPFAEQAYQLVAAVAAVQLVDVGEAFQRQHHAADRALVARLAVFALLDQFAQLHLQPRAVGQAGEAVVVELAVQLALGLQPGGGLHHQRDDVGGGADEVDVFLAPGSAQGAALGADDAVLQAADHDAGVEHGLDVALCQVGAQRQQPVVLQRLHAAEVAVFAQCVEVVGVLL
ncbi:hypothetical protein D3C85_1341360 [compost metagenome]